MVGDHKAVSLGRYLRGNAHGVKSARRAGAAATSDRQLSDRPRRGAGAESHGVEARDPVEVILLAGDRDEYVDRSFWHDAEADGVTFEESRVDGKWEEGGAEWWK
jgi:hypothetical protein